MSLAKHKQEKIREGTAKWLFDTDYQFTAQWEDAQPFLKTEYYKKADMFLSYLHSKKCRIEVERELPELEHPHYFKEGITSDTDLITFAKAIELEVKAKMLKAGYVAVEPLIEK